MNTVIEWLSQPWPWYIGGITIGAMVPLLLFLANEPFGISSSLRHICAASLPSKTEYFNYNWKAQSWNLVFVIGVIGGGLLANLLVPDQQIAISQQTQIELTELGITDLSGLMPAQLFNFEALTSLHGLVLIVVGGFLVGFGSRYAGGCTSGHAIMGLSMFSVASLVAVLGFFAGGLIITHLVFPILFQVN